MASIDINGRIEIFPSVDPGGNTLSSSAGSDELTNIPKAESGSALDTLVKSGEWTAFDLDTSIVPNFTIEKLEKATEKLKNISDVLASIMKFLQLFLTSFNSFSGIISSLLDFVDTEINKWLKDLGGAGVFFNALFPPGFNRNLLANLANAELFTGGFPGFIKRLQVSLNNTADPNRPVFSSDALVGGLIILVDAKNDEDAEKFYEAWEQLKEQFNFLNLLPINTSPSPPTNIRGVSKLENGQYKILLEMDPPAVKPGPIRYRISRSIVPGGVPTKTRDIPKNLFGDDGFLNALKKRMSNFFAAKAAKRRGLPPPKETGDWPTRIVYVYDDRDPEIIRPNIVNGTGQFIDDQIEADENGDPKVSQYYYVVESGFGRGNIWVGGSRSNEIAVPVEKSCIDSGIAAVIEHKKGHREYISAGRGGIGKWSSIRTQLLLPFLPQLTRMINSFLKTLKGMVKNTSDSFSDFIKGIQEKFETYSFIIDLMLSLIQKLQETTVNNNVAFLYIKPQKGGVQEFMRRVRTAKQPEDGFSDKEGICAGVVFMFGAPDFDPFGDSDSQSISLQAEAISKSFEILMQLLTGGSS